MRKFVLVAVLILFLTGCTKKTINQALNSALSQPLPVAANHTKEFYRYYLPPSVGVRATNKNSSILLVEGHEVLMNLNISRIVSEQYYEGLPANESTDESNLLFKYDGSYYDANMESHQFSLKLFGLNNNENALYINNGLVEMVSVIPASAVNIVTESMITIMRSVDVDKKQVVAAYSTKEVIEKDAIFSQFFEQIPPETGTLKDMYDQMNPNKDK